MGVGRIGFVRASRPEREGVGSQDGPEWSLGSGEGWQCVTRQPTARAHLDAAAVGRRVFIGFDRSNYSGQGLIQGNTEHVPQRVAALRDNAGLFCWYLLDEPEHAYRSPIASRATWCMSTGLGTDARRCEQEHGCIRDCG